MAVLLILSTFLKTIKHDKLLFKEMLLYKLVALRKDFVILQLYWCCLVAQNTVAKIWSNAW